ncbi:proline-, glutamic acid- and leucine-rich protein 1-like [Hordeum vulgare subsp. vulgare]|uniref:Predicted protein n=1 Tax=Hordeum vulgare subsp. vulgare TaxID=112509 RepID=F2DEE9_HORVV|nr:proline-, glutamic acid- and leucine-rich protein 1-like [Hordeum vulgare subsp. vulgare]BAJ93470.1 predicted protein [Hordeum vulgare subsp. vulgare]
MRRFLTHLHHHSHRLRPSPPLSCIPTTKNNLPFLVSRRLLSDDASPPAAAPLPPPPPPPAAAPPPPPPPSAIDVPNEELRRRLETYYKVEDEVELSTVAVAVLERKLADAHSETDDELIEELRNRPLPQVHDRDFEADFDEMHDTDEELTDLYNARQYVEKKMKDDESFNMNDTKWDEEIKKATEKGQLSNMKECEDILEDMLHWDKLLPDEIKQKVEAKFNELGDMCERGELEPEQAYELFKEFEDKMVSECTELMEAEPLTVDELSGADNKSVELNDPPGEGPVLRWESRIVFAPGGDAWHPKNRKVKLSVTVKELGLSRHAFRRLREVVGKRYNSGKDELTIISERFDHREENRKDCMRTLYALVEDAMKADVLANAARDAYVKGRLQANSHFMDRLKMKTQKLRQAA